MATLINGQHCLSDTHYKTQEASRMSILQTLQKPRETKERDKMLKLTSILVKPSKQTPHGEEEAGNSAILPY